MSASVIRPPVKSGDIVLHLRNARRMYVESVDRRIIFCAWMDETGEIHRGAYGVDWLVPRGMALA